jgi:hypothetical protein
MKVTHRKTKIEKKPARLASPPASMVVRRSFALPRHIVAQATAVAPAALQGNLNRLVTTALQVYTEARKRQTFEDAMAAMAADPAICRASTDLMAVFRTTEADGLPDD